VLSAALRLETLPLRPLWTDEQFTHDVATQASGVQDVWHIAERDGQQHPPLHYLVAFVALRLHDSPASLRLPSVLCGVLSVALLIALGSALFDRRVGLTAGLLAACSVYHIDYSQEGRPYMLLLALSEAQLLSAYAFLRAPRWPSWAAFVALGTASVHTHHLGVVSQAALLAIFAGHFLAGWRTSREQGEPSGPRPTLPAVAAAAAAFASIGLAYAPQLSNLSGFLGSDHLEARHTLLLSPRFFLALCAHWGSGPGWSAAAWALLFAAGAVRAAARPRGGAGLLVWFAAPFLVFASLPFAKFFDIRFAMTALPAFLLLVAVGLHACAGLARGIALRGGAGRRVVERTGAAAALALLIPLVAMDARAYLTFRETGLRCSEFPRDPHILRMKRGFCRDFLLLNTLLPENRYLLRPLGDGSGAREP
jgi:4-amino-4-deoxy-L-arabinose transferase-like glycosyltransferase